MTNKNSMRIRFIVKKTNVRSNFKFILKLISWLQHRIIDQMINVKNTFENQFVNQMRKVNEIEMHAQKFMIVIDHNCKIIVSKYQNLMIVKVWSNNIFELNDDNINVHVFEQTYQIDNFKLFFFVKQVKINFLFDSDELIEWVFNIVKSLSNFKSEIFILEVMLNKFKNQNLKKTTFYTKRENNVKFTSIMIDILNDRSNKTLSQFATNINQILRKVANFLSTKIKFNLLFMISCLIRKTKLIILIFHLITRHMTSENVLCREKQRFCRQCNFCFFELKSKFQRQTTKNNRQNVQSQILARLKINDDWQKSNNIKDNVANFDWFQSTNVDHRFNERCCRQYFQ